MRLCIVATTVDSEEGARKIARAALEARLAACAQIFPIRSLYRWKGELRDDAEFLVQMKARREDHDRLAETIRSLHPYEVPEILRYDVAAGDARYLEWVGAQTAREKDDSNA